MNQSVAVRDTRDPFSQALSLLFREAKNPDKLKEKYREEITPLVTQVALKIGAIDTEKVIAERAIPVFVGMISLHLAGIKNGSATLTDWVAEIQSETLSTLFRKGYTMFHSVKDIMVTVELSDGGYNTPMSPVERMELYSNYKEQGVWAGYALYTAHIASREGIETKRDFCLWLVEITHGREIAREANQNEIDPGGLDEGTIIRRCLYNILFIGKPSLHMDYHKVESMVIAAKRPGWRVRAK